VNSERMSEMLKLVLLTVLVASLAALGRPSRIALASPIPSTTITLSCTNTADAQVTLQLWDTPLGSVRTGDISLDCGKSSPTGNKRTSVKITTPNFNPGWVNISVFDVQSPAFIGDCSGGSSFPAKVMCPLSGKAAAKLTVR
jgi:hypothetical protein